MTMQEKKDRRHSLWVEMAVLAIVIVVVIMLAAKYVW